jgi:hypothetical protein
VSGDEYTFHTNVFSDPLCATANGGYDTVYTVGTCSDSGVITGVVDSFPVKAGGVTWKAFDTGPLCNAEDPSEIISGFWAEMNVCYVHAPYDSSFKYTSCDNLNFYGTTTCSGYAVGYPFNATCELNVEDDDDDDYHGNLYKTSVCRLSNDDDFYDDDYSNDDDSYGDDDDDDSASSFTASTGLTSVAAAVALALAW